jgi:FkbM family methyltransferase
MWQFDSSKAIDVVKSSVNGLLGRGGLEIVVARHRPIERFLRARQIELVLDVGANAGQYARLIRRLGYEGRIISFEPASEPFNVLERTSRSDPRWEARRLALGAGDNIGTLNVGEASVFSSLLSPRRRAVDFDSRAQIAAVEKVEIVRLDTIFPQLPRTRTLLKLDVQGYEREVLLGAARSLPLIAGVQLEAAFSPLYEDQPDATELMILMRDHGFSPAAVIQSNHYDHHETYRLLEADFLFVNDRLDQNGATPLDRGQPSDAAGSGDEARLRMS